MLWRESSVIGSGIIDLLYDGCSSPRRRRAGRSLRAGREGADLARWALTRVAGCGERRDMALCGVLDRVCMPAGSGSAEVDALAHAYGLYDVDHVAVLAAQLTAGMVPDGHSVEKWSAFRLYVDYGHRYGRY